ncbi:MULTISPECIES: hypothetical protein [Pseudomonas]|uniref:Uncharacterized protein n=1 Tax=Pseudomonas donghuensis TaxID=1163398 RepID=A0AAQ0ISA1_9PSED|nr:MULTISPECIES: hypothetical protein [Pseudomonas]MDF9893967.1 uncharacterized protein GlcG (DUF336 family) [Pseudomonas vranovensis]MCP6693798.1 hypothetical protein [Pseudomonas donghuensis]MCP6697522.1 hypothetical protein [Pseudomonas donghuensis]QWE81323.1 hypothetical protein BV82_15910 [Pseudomonas donghuensis]UVL22254.1 hypothetical protein LOY30_15410 [Pseudomonas donghuensis]
MPRDVYAFTGGSLLGESPTVGGTVGLTGTDGNVHDLLRIPTLALANC